MNPYIFNIQKFSVHDGPGIRTTVFFKGCPLHCLWCHNPESQRYGREFLFDRAKCTGCGYCIKGCRQGAIAISDENPVAITDPDQCILCEDCTDYCVENNREVVGKQYELEELVRILLQDKVFYEESGGGVTLSGGEVMTQDMDYIENLCRSLKEQKVSVAVDTCGFAPRENFERILPYIDLFLYDIKTMDDCDHQKYTGKSNELIRKNLEYLASQNAHLNIRIPVIPSVNDSERSMLAILSYLKTNVGFTDINLLPYHKIGKSKYDKLGWKNRAEDFQVPEEAQMEKLKQLFEKNGFKHVKIGG